jgi:hypothetical protein
LIQLNYSIGDTMDKITKEIEELAEKMEKSVTDPNDRLFSIIKSLGKDGLKAKLADLSDEEKVTLKATLEEMTLKKAISFDKEAQSVKFVQGKVVDTIIQEDKADDDVDETLVKPQAAKMDHQGTPTDGWQGQVIKSIEDSEELMEQVIEKAMGKCKDDDKMVMKKLKEKGMNESKVQGALDKFKAKKDSKKPAEQVEKSVLPETENPEAKKQSGDVPNLEDGKTCAKKTPAPEIEALGKDNKKNMTKSITWEDDNRLFKANTLGRNFNFNLEQFVSETLASEGTQSTEPVKKSDTKEDLNDIIEKSQDTTWSKIAHEKQASEHKITGKLQKSFSDEDLAASMGITVEEAKKLLGE